MYKAIIIDDEENAIKGLKLLIEHTALKIDIVGTANNVVEGLKILRQKEPDIVFLDIEMHGPTGFDFLELADRKNRYFIFVTAHEEYAIKAIKHNIHDYLLKPVSTEDLEQAMKKAFQFLENVTSSSEQQKTHRISINTNDGMVFKDLKDVIYIKAKNRYSDIHCTDGSIHNVCKNIGEYEEELATKNFFRVHKSFLVNCSHVLKINNIDGGFIQLTGGSEVEISRRKKSEFLEKIKR